MLIKSLVRKSLVTASLLVMAGAAQAAPTYTLLYISLETGNAPGQEFFFGAGSLAASTCDTCWVSTAVDDGLGNLTLDTISFKLSGFGANFRDVFQGTTTVGVGGILDKTSETCTVFNAAVQYCSATDPRSYAQDWRTGLQTNGVTPSPTTTFSAVVTGTNLRLSVRKPLLVTDPIGSASWLQLNFNYAVVPVPAAVWLFGSAAGLLGFMRRRSVAAS